MWYIAGKDLLSDKLFVSHRQDQVRSAMEYDLVDKLLEVFPQDFNPKDKQVETFMSKMYSIIDNLSDDKLAQALISVSK